jgi:hypothetical protein
MSLIGYNKLIPILLMKKMSKLRVPEQSIFTKMHDPKI